MKTLLINSTLMFVSAFFLTTFIHESGHYLAYLMLGADPVLHHNYVATASDSLPDSVRIPAALAGPFISLLQGLVASVFLSRMRSKGPLRLLVLWLALLGFVNVFGYLMMTPLSSVGDTGKAAMLLGMGSALRWAVALAGFAALLLSVARVGRRFADFIPGRADIDTIRRYVYQVMFFPILIGAGVNMLFTLPAPAVLSLVYSGTSAFVIMSSFPAAMKQAESLGSGYATPSQLENRILPSLIGLFLVCVALNRLLVGGVG